jgi:hypothetical protein
MKFAKWLRVFVDELLRTGRVRALEIQWAEAVQRTRDILDSTEARERANWESLELQLLRQRQDLTERIRDKDAVIADLRVRLAIAETDAMRERIEKQKRAAVKPVPDFGGPISFQDELAAMSLEVDETQEKTNEVR